MCPMGSIAIKNCLMALWSKPRTFYGKNDMSKFTRRNVLQTGIALAIPPVVLGVQPSIAGASQQAESSETTPESQESNSITAGDPIKIQYLEIVTPEVDGLCRQYSSIYGISFGEPDANFGGARTAELDGGGWIGIRGPLRDTEMPVVRPYVLVDDIKAAVESAVEAGAKIAMPPMEIPDRGMFAIAIHGGIDCGFWQT